MAVGFEVDWALPEFQGTLKVRDYEAGMTNGYKVYSPNIGELFSP